MACWWKNGIVYQIYPRSFQDSNGDGIGDIPGIISRLDYLRDLGVDAVWLSPIFQSPMADFGYDISDYRAIDPVFGSLADFDRLLAEAHARGIRVLLDGVFNHTSEKHPWFLESASSRSNPKRDWYLWNPGIKGKPPSNWMAVFGGRVWEKHPATGEYYMHAFLKEQPDLNWHNPEVRKAVFGEMKFWLDRGVDGFRLDVVNYYLKDAELRNNPFTMGEYPRPYDLQSHVYDRDRPEMHALLRELRTMIDTYPDRMTVGEVMVDKPGNPELSASYLGAGDELHLAFDFTVFWRKWNAESFREAIGRYYSGIHEKAWPVITFSNHDKPRAIDRYQNGPETVYRARAAAVLLLTLRGTPFIYYGEEIGLRQGKIPRKRIVDPLGVKYWPVNPGRDGERTPMQWTGETHAGFSTVEPWLPVNRDHQRVNAQGESQDPHSLLSLYKKIISIRRDRPALHSGSFRELPAPKGVFAFLRDAPGAHSELSEEASPEPVKGCAVFVNFTSAAVRCSLSEPGVWKGVFSTHTGKGEGKVEAGIILQPDEAVILERNP
jgi:alpha-glucosidase